MTRTTEPDMVLDSEHKTFLVDYLENRVSDGANFHLAVHHQDEMFHKAILPGCPNTTTAYFRYLESGHRMLTTLRQVAAYFFSGFSEITSFLEFGCGYGRFTRFLLQEMPAAKVWAMDIYEEAVAWQREYLGVNGVVSFADPRGLRLSQRFDFIFAGSVFSHLPERLFEAWLKALYGLLADDGVLVFSVHDKQLVENSDASAHFIFEKVSESDTLPVESYGSTYVTEHYVRSAISEATASRQYAHFKKALYENQDIYIVKNGFSGVQLSEIDLKIPPLGGLEGWWIDSNGRLQITGWAIDFNGVEGAIEEVRLLRNGAVVGRTALFADRLDVLRYFPSSAAVPIGWSFAVPIQRLSSGDVLACEIKSRTGLDCIYYVPWRGIIEAANGQSR